MPSLDAVLGDVVAAEERVDDQEVRDDAVAVRGEEVSEQEADPDARSHLERAEAADETEAAVATVSVGDVLGVPLWYERIAAPGPRRFPVAPSFRPVLEATLRQVLERVPDPWGKLQRISTAGLYVGKAGMHGRGRACDWDRLVFAHAEVAPRAGDHASPSLAKRQRYWALAAICRSNSAYVLHGHYDADHRDHIHQDDGGALAFRRDSFATVTLVQVLLNDVFGQSPELSVDGDFGRRTTGALQSALDKVQLAGSVEDVAVWRKFLRGAGRLGFTLSA
jgi:hypothetical protein